MCKSSKNHQVGAIKIYCTTPCYILKNLTNFFYSSICSLLCYSGRILWQPHGRSCFYLFVWCFYKTLCFLNYVQVCLWYCTHILSGESFQWSHQTASGNICSPKRVVFSWNAQCDQTASGNILSWKNEWLFSWNAQWDQGPMYTPTIENIITPDSLLLFLFYCWNTI